MSSSNSSYMKAFAGVILIAVIIAVVNNFSKKADIQDYSKYKEKIDNNKRLHPFSETQKDSVSLLLAGFWQYDKPAVDTSTPGISDRIEIKENGIIWRVITYKYLTSANDTARFMHAMTAYLRPFASRKDNPSHLTFDTHIIRQTFAGTDTCYGIGTVDTTWEIIRTQNSLLMNHVTYVPFDTSDLAHFFPQRAVAMVDDVKVNPCKSAYLQKDFRALALKQPNHSLQ